MLKNAHIQDLISAENAKMDIIIVLKKENVLKMKVIKT